MYNLHQKSIHKTAHAEASFIILKVSPTDLTINEEANYTTVQQIHCTIGIQSAAYLFNYNTMNMNFWGKVYIGSYKLDFRKYSI